MRHIKDTFLVLFLVFFALFLVVGFFLFGYWFVYGELPG